MEKSEREESKSKEMKELEETHVIAISNQLRLDLKYSTMYRDYIPMTELGYII